MVVFMGKLLTILLCIFLFEGGMVQSVTYDHTASIECLSNPMKPLYNGGIIHNSEFDSGLTGWLVPSGVNATVRSSPSGNKFAEARNNIQPSRSVFLKVQMLANTHYSLSAWLKVSAGPVGVKAIINAPGGAYVAGGAIVARPGCWVMLKGGMTAYSSGPATIIFQANGVVDISVDSVSLQPFSFDEWRSHSRASAAKARRSSVKVVVSGTGSPLANATLGIELLGQPRFPIGNAMTPEILHIPAYEQWFASRFTVATFENEMKWYSTEPTQNHEDYRVPDAMLALAQRHGIKVRGHNVFWDDPNTQMGWVGALKTTDQLRSAMEKRLHSVVTRYAGKVIGWDVVNENLHGNFYEQKLGPAASGQMYQDVSRLDPAAPLFMNEYNTVESPLDMGALSCKYVAKMEQIRSYPGNAGIKLAVGLESHFSTPNMPYMRATLDTLAQLKIPIWLTEVDVAPGPKQAEYLEDVLREGYGHPNVDGIVMWAAWHAKGCYVMCLTDNGFRNLPVGDVVDKLLAEWKTVPTAATTDENGVAELDLVHGEYRFTVAHPSVESPVAVAGGQRLTVDASAAAVLEHAIDIKA